MEKPSELTELFEAHRSHLRAVAYRMPGSLAEADDAIQKAWLRMEQSGATGIRNIRGWLTTIVARVCLDMLRSRNSPVLDPNVVVRIDEGARVPGAPSEIRGAQNWAKGALAFSRSARFVQPALINGAAGAPLGFHGSPSRALTFLNDDGKRVPGEITGAGDRLRPNNMSGFHL